MLKGGPWASSKRRVGGVAHMGLLRKDFKLTSLWRIQIWSDWRNFLTSPILGRNWITEQKNSHEFQNSPTLSIPLYCLSVQSTDLIYRSGHKRWETSGNTFEFRRNDFSWTRNMWTAPAQKLWSSHKNIHDHTYSALLIYLHVLVGRLRYVSFEILAHMKLTDKGIQEKIRRAFYEVSRRLLFNFNVSVFSKIAIFFFLQLSFNLKSSLPPVVESTISSNTFCLVTGTSLTIISSEEDNEPALD